MSPDAKARRIKQLGRELGFDLIGLMHARPTPRAAYYRQWLDQNRAGAMAYLARNVEQRIDPRRVLPGARAIICVALSYNRHSEPPCPPSPAAGPAGRIARYARGADYHRVLHELLARLDARLRAEFDEPFESRVFVDTGPLLERELAAAAGLGWIGKNTLLMHRKLGSYLLLGELLTTLDAAPDEPETDHCGSCTRCLEACPTQAFPAPYQMDAARCISYLTIEKRGELPADLQQRMGDWVFGCDVCQEVCPHNRHAPPGTQAALCAEHIPPTLPLLPLSQLRAGEYRRMTRGSATARATQAMWKRNAQIALQNAARHAAGGGGRSDASSENGKCPVKDSNLRPAD